MGRREAQRERMRARLLDAAMHLFVANGYDATTIDQIAARADVARQTVLNHYPQKRDLVRAWGQHRRDQLADLAVPAGPGVPARDELHRYFAALAGMSEREREPTRVLHLSLRPDEVLAHERPVPDAVLATVRSAQQRRELDSGWDPALAAEVLTAVYFDTLTRWLAGAEPAFDLTAVLARKLDLVLNGLASPK
jgi:AcrR family transcriptional regulator